MGLAEHYQNQLRAECSSQCTKSGLVDIAMIGALGSQDARAQSITDLGRNDYHFLKRSIRLVHDYRHNNHSTIKPIASNFNVQVINPSLGENFLTNTVRADVLIMCNIDQWKYAWDDQSLPMLDWQEAAINSGATFIIPFGLAVDAEIGIVDFVGPFEWLCNDGAIMQDREHSGYPRCLGHLMMRSPE